MTERRTESLRVQVTVELKELVVAEAKRDDVSEAHVVRRALRFYFTTKEDKTIQTTQD